MGNFFKNFALNKTTVTIIGIIAGAAVLIIGYMYRTNTTTSTTYVYYVSEDVKSNQQLSENIIKRTRVNSSLLNTSKNLVTNLDDIKDKNGEFFYVNYGYYLNAGDLLMSTSLIAKENKSDEKLYQNLKEGETIFKIDVDMDSTHGNSIQKGNSIDIYVDGKDGNDVIYTKFIENLKVLDVVDNRWSTTKGKSDNTNEASSAPTYLVTAVNEEMFQLLTKITMLGNYSFKLVPEDTRKAYVENSEAKIVNEHLKDIVEAHTFYAN